MEEYIVKITWKIYNVFVIWVYISIMDDLEEYIKKIQAWQRNPWVSHHAPPESDHFGRYTVYRTRNTRKSCVSMTL